MESSLFSKAVVDKWAGPYFALGNNGENRQVLLFCSPRGNPVDRGCVKFYVHNGAWAGKFYPETNILKIDGDQKSYPANVLWVGDLPPSENKWDYNESMAWIQEQVDCRSN